MKRVFRSLLCYAGSFAALFLSGYGNLMNHISPSLAMTTMLGSALILSVIIMLIWEVHLGYKNRINELSYRLDKIEAENQMLKDQSEDE